MSDYAAAIFAMAAMALGLMYLNDRRAGPVTGTYYDDVQCSDGQPVRRADGTTFYPAIVCEWTTR